MRLQGNKCPSAPWGCHFPALSGGAHSCGAGHLDHRGHTVLHGLPEGHRGQKLWHRFQEACNRAKSLSDWLSRAEIPMRVLQEREKQVALPWSSVLSAGPTDPPAAEEELIFRTGSGVACGLSLGNLNGQRESQCLGAKEPPVLLPP